MKLKKRSDFFTERTTPLHLNTSVWNNHDVSKLTGYSIEMLKEPLYFLAKFI